MGKPIPKIYVCGVMLVMVINNNFSGLKPGKYWAAIKDDMVVAVVFMNAPQDLDFDGYRESAVNTLSASGDVVSGEIVILDGYTVFAKRLTHKNRSKNSSVKREPQIFQFAAR